MRIDLKNLSISPEILNLIAELDEFKGMWKTLTTLTPEKLLSLKRIATIESIGSSTRIEGATLTNQQVEALLNNIHVQHFQHRDEQEVAGYADVMDTIFMAWEDIPLSENYIRQLHRDLLKYSQKDERHRGSYKTLSNSVAAFDEDGKQLGIVFETSTPFETPAHMQRLMVWLNKTMEDKAFHPLIIVSVFAVVFLAIHPFQDGNGRLSRVLTTLLLLKLGYAYVPYSSLEKVIEENKDTYYVALRKTQGTLKNETTHWEPWLLFFLRSLKSQKKRLEAKMKQEELLLAALPETSLALLECARSETRLTLAKAVHLTGINRNTLRDHFKKLVQDGYLVQHGKGKGTWYSLASTSK